MSTSRPDVNDPSRAPLWRVTTVVYWFVVVDLLMLLVSAPAVVMFPLLEPDRSNIPLFALSLVPVGPALAAAVFAWRVFVEDRDLRPARHFFRGYRLNAVDSLRVWLPALVMVTVMAMNVAYGEIVGLTAVYTVVAVVVLVVVLVLMAHALVIGALFSFRWRDTMRLGAYYLVTSPRASFGTLSLLVVTVGAVALVSDWILYFIASALAYFLVVNDLPMVEDVRTRFVGAGPGAVEEPEEPEDPEDGAEVGPEAGSEDGADESAG